MLPSLIALAAMSAGPHTFDGRHDISTIDLTIVYLVPRDREPLTDWRERVDYYAKRIDAFHTRESSSASKLQITIHPTPLILEKDTETLRGKNPNETFFNSTREASNALKWRDRKKAGFPIILVLGEINWRELDDFTRTRMVDGKPVHEGNLAVAGYALFFGSPSAIQTALALRQAIWRKGRPGWQACGIPEILYSDHGSDFTSRHLEQVAADLKIRLIHSMVGRPRGPAEAGEGSRRLSREPRLVRGQVGSPGAGRGRGRQGDPRPRRT